MRLRRSLRRSSEQARAPIAVEGARVTVIGAVGDVERDASVASLGLEGQPGVDRVMPILKPYKLASSQITSWRAHGARHRRAQDRGRSLRAHRGPVNGRVARADAEGPSRVVARRRGDAAGAAGAYKPRTSPYAFQGLGQEGLRLLAEAKEQTGPADRHRADGRARHRRRARGRGRDPDRVTQHAELPAAGGGRVLRTCQRCSSAACPRLSTSC